MAGVSTMVGSVFHLMYTRGENIESEHEAAIGLDGRLSLKSSKEIREAAVDGIKIIFQK